MSGWAGTHFYYVVLGALCGAIGFRLGWRIPPRAGLPFGLPLTQAVFGYLGFVATWRGLGPSRALLVELGWALGTSAVALYVFRHTSEEEVDARVWRAARYRNEMFAWLRSGRGFASRPLATAGRHLVELAVYLAVALISANFLAMILGAALLNYMNAYVASLLRAARQPFTVALLGWNVWSVIRVVAYVLLGVAATGPLAKLGGYPVWPGMFDAYWLAGGIGVAVDLLLKLILSRPCGRRLGAAIDPAALTADGG